MPNDDNACIRYLMKEMDPSEEVLMERAMMEDEDLLIEVECMRQTLRRLDQNLPLMDPPSHVTEKIIAQAAQQKASSPAAKMLNVRKYQYFAAAAILLVGFLAGALWLQVDVTKTDNAETNSNSNSAAITATPAYDALTTPASASEPEVEPWVDRNEVLRFQDQFDMRNGSQAEYDSILNTTTKKLRLINDPLQPNARSRSLQLTGSDN